jgi:hypothetical protein
LARVWAFAAALIHHQPGPGGGEFGLFDQQHGLCAGTRSRLRRHNAAGRATLDDDIVGLRRRDAHQPKQQKQLKQE